VRAVGFARVRAPRIFCAQGDRHRHELLTFLAELRERLVVKRLPVTVDFALTSRMLADGTLLFLAELRRCQEILNGHMTVRCILPRNVKVAQVLKQIGALALLNCHKKIVPKFPDVIHWRYASGYQVQGEKYENLLGSYDGRVAGTLLSSLFKGVTEAMTNCHHHAYIGIRPDGLNYQDTRRNWWMFSRENDGYLTVVFCDLGIGIPVTVPTRKPSLWKRLLSMGKAGSDSKIIEQAVQDAISRTGKRYRGKGLKQLIGAVQAYDDGQLVILSNRGSYTFRNGDVKLRDYVASINGTLIQWKVPIGQRGLFS